MTQNIVNNGWSTGSPGSGTNVPGRVVVGIGCVPARSTFEVGLTPSVGLIDVSARRAFTTGVAWIDKKDRDASKGGFICHESPQLMERPISHTCPLSASDLCPPANALEIFQSNAAFGALRILHDGLRDGVVGDFLEPRLLAFGAIELAPGDSRSLPLQVAASVGMDTTDQFHIRTTMLVPITVRCDVDDAKINADPIFGVEFLGLWHITCADQKPLAADVGKICLAFPVLEKIPLPDSGNPGHLDASFDRPERHDIVRLEAHQPVVIGLSSQTLEFRADLSVNLESVGHFGDAAHRGLSSQIKALTTILVSKLVQIKLPDTLFLEGTLSKPRTSLIAALQRCFQSFLLLRRRLELYRGANLHILKYRRFIAMFQLFFGAHIPPSPKGDGLLRGL